MADAPPPHDPTEPYDARGSNERAPQRGDPAQMRPMDVLDEGDGRHGPPDPGTPRTRAKALLLGLLAFLIVAGLQALPSGTATPPEAAAAIEPPEPHDPLVMTARIVVTLSENLRGHRSRLMGQLEAAAVTDADRVRVAMAAGELEGPEGALSRLGSLTIEEETLAEDVEILKRTYAEGSGALDAGQRDRLVDHHGWFGELALVHDLPRDGAARQRVVLSGAAMIVVLFIAGGVIATAFLAGFALAIWFVVQMASGRMRPRFVAPAPGGSVYLETFSLFVGAFLLVLIATGVLHLLVPRGSGGTGLFLVQFAAQWLLLAVPLWPLARGVPWRRLRMDLGLHAGAGVLREVAWGVLGYLAGLPLLLAGAMLVALMSMIARVITGETPQPDSPVVDLVSEPSTLLVAMVLLLAVVWAPLVEEAVFRGALYRHVRSRVGPLLAAVLVGLAFAFMHGYGPIFTPPLLALAITFALLREWRGSLIAPITAHFLHNATVLAVILSLLAAAR